VVGEQFKLFKIKNHLSLFSNKQNTYLKRLLQLKNHDSFLFNYRGWRTVLSWLENSFIVPALAGIILPIAAYQRFFLGAAWVGGGSKRG